MDWNEARSRLESFCPPSEDPELTVSQVTHLLALAVTTDADGNDPTDDDWTPTYSTVGVWRAVAEGWDMKAGIASSRYSFTTDGQRFERQQVVDHCQAMADRYRRKLSTSIATRG